MSSPADQLQDVNMNILEAVQQDLNLRMQNALLQQAISAIRKGDRESVIQCLEQRLRIDFSDDNSDTLLHHAAGHSDIVRMLLERGAPADQLNNAGESPAFFAVRHNDEESLQLLFDFGDIDVNSIDSTGKTLFHYANELQHHSISKMLLERGADPKRPNFAELKNVMDAAGRGETGPIIKYIHEGGDVNVPDKWGNNLLHYVGEFPDLVRYLLLCGANPYNENHNGETPALYALRRGNFKSLKILVQEGGFDVNTVDSKGKTLLYHMDLYCRSNVQKNEYARKISFFIQEMIYELAEKAADDKRNSFEKLLALSRQRLNREYIFDETEIQKVYRNSRYKICSPIVYALRKGNISAARVLLKAKVNPSQAALYAIEQGSDEPNVNDFAIALIQEIQYVNKGILYYLKQRRKGRIGFSRITLLEQALSVKNISLDIVQLLLNRGAIVNQNIGRNPADQLASRHPDRKINHDVACHSEYLNMAMRNQGPNAVKIVENLLQAGAKVGGKTYKHQDWRTHEYLKDRRKRKNVHFRNVPLLLASKKEGFHHLYPLLINRDKITVDTRDDKTGRTALLEACYRHDVSSINTLLQLRSDPNFVNDDYSIDGPSYKDTYIRTENPLACAAHGWKAIIIVPLLVAYGASFHFKDHEGNTVLHQAYRSEIQALVLMLEKLFSMNTLGAGACDLYNERNDKNLTAAAFHKREGIKLNFLTLFPLLEDCFDHRKLDDFAKLFAEGFHKKFPLLSDQNDKNDKSDKGDKGDRIKTLDLTTIEDKSLHDELTFLEQEMKKFWNEHKAIFYLQYLRSLKNVEQVLNKKGFFWICSCEAPITQFQIQEYLDTIFETVILGIVFYNQFRARPRPVIERVDQKSKFENEHVMSTIVQDGQKRRIESEQVMRQEKHGSGLLYYYDATGNKQSLNWHVASDVEDERAMDDEIGALMGISL